MNNIIDVVGIDGVSKVMEAAKLCRFRIYKETDGKGSTPTFESINTSQNARAVGAFRTWANLALSNNPYNSQVYSMFLYSKTTDSDIEDDEDDDDKMSKKKKDKIKFTFALTNSNPYTGQQTISGPQEFPDVKQAVKDALNQQREQTATEKLVDELKGYREELKAEKEAREDEEIGKDKEEKETKEEDDGMSFESFSDTIKNVRDIIRDLKDKKGAMAGDEDDDDDDLEEGVTTLVRKQDEENITDVDYEEVNENTPGDDDDSLEPDDDEPGDDDDSLEPDDDEPGDDDEKPDDDEAPEKKNGYTEEEQAGIDAKRQRLGKALKILLAHHKNIDKDLMLLAKMAQQKPEMFKQAIGMLRGMKL